MCNVDDLAFCKFVANNLSHEELKAIEQALINEGEADATLLASIAFYCTNEDLVAELLGDDIDSDLYEDDNIKKIDFIEMKTNKQNNTSMDNKFKLAPGTAAAVAFSAKKLFEMYKSGRFDYFTNRNIASNINNGDETWMGSVNEGESDNNIGLAQAETTYGLPNLDIEFNPDIYQYYPDTCAFQSQALILREYGYDVTQEDLMQIAKEQGWYVEGYGTPEDKVGKLLEYYGLDTSMTEGNNIFNLANELAQGHRVLVTVDSGELWSPGLGEKLEDLLIGDQADHALLVVGVDTSSSGGVKVIVNDPGNGNTQYAYSEKEFMNAWSDSMWFMVSTNDVPTENPMYPSAPIDNFAGIPMETLDTISGMDINIEDEELYADFYQDFLENPFDLDNLISQYEDLFIPDFEE